MDEKNVILCNSLVKQYPEQLGKSAKPALKGISFSLKQGQTLGLIGANGAGKSTCIRILMGFMRPTSGTIQLLGSSTQTPYIHSKIGYLPELASFPSSLTCMDIIRFAGKSAAMSHPEIQKQSEYWLHRLKLYDARNQLLKSFSKGMQQRASFIIALIHNPELLILDEPMSGLDPLGRAEIVNLIQELKEQGKSILFCSHLLNDVERLADQIVILHQGKLLLHGKTQEAIGQHPNLESLFLHTIKQAEHGGPLC